MKPPRKTLPIDSRLEEIAEAIEKSPSLVLVAEPGAGKSTRVPPALRGGQWILLQPRRVAARLCAERMAEEGGSAVGQEIGYQIRFESKVSASTRIRVITEGILAQWIRRDPELQGIKGVILDEFHERSVHADFALALLKEIQSSLRPDLKIIVMSATLDARAVSDFLDQAPIIEVSGRGFPIEIVYSPLPESSFKRPFERFGQIAAKIDHQISQIPNGDVLVFLPGLAEIRRTEEALRERGLKDIEILHSSVPIQTQKRILSSQPAGVRVILSTNIAETSVTLPHVVCVIDGGRAKQMRVDPQFGFETLQEISISQASARQRAGRAGRVQGGRCVRLYSESALSMFKPFDTPEILRADLAPFVLMLREWGVQKSDEFGWFECPPRSQLAQAESLLTVIGALDPQGQITELGQQVLRMPLPARFAVFLYQAVRYGIESWASEWVLKLSGEPIRALIEEVISRVRVSTETSGALPTRKIRALFAAFPDRLTRQGILAGGRGVKLDSGLTLHSEFWFSLDIQEIKVQGQRWVRVQAAEEFSRDEIFLALGEKIEKRTDLFWDDSAERVMKREGTFLGGLMLEAGQPSPARSEAAEVILAQNIVARGEAFLFQNPELKSLVERCRFLKRLCPESKIWEWNEEQIAPVARELARQSNSLNEVAKKPLADFFATAMGYEALQELDRECPARLQVPSGRSYAIEYGDAQPKLEVRLQELFGLLQTPKIVRGQVPLLIGLLAPNYRPVQWTSDLQSFWSQTYVEVRKELRARYPKHAWPDDPKTAKPVAKGGRNR